MKKTLILFLMLITSIARCQDTNFLTLEEYDNIQVNKISLANIRNTKGDPFLINGLFGEAERIEKDNDPIYGDPDYIDSIDFYFDGLELSFFQYELSNFDILNQKSKLTIREVTFTIGDNINVLGENIVFNTKRNGSKSIVFSPMEGWNNFITIDFDQETKLITAIYYIELT